jgi:xylulokinase
MAYENPKNGFCMWFRSMGWYNRSVGAASAVQYIIAHDVGTSGNKAVLVDAEGRVYGKCFEPYGIYYPNPGWAEQEPADWWRAVTKTTRLLLEKTRVSPKDILGITFSTQMLGIIPMDPREGALRRAIIWLDSRADEQAERLMRKFINARVFALIAGATLCGKDGLPKLVWLKEKEPEIYNKMRCFLDVAGYLFYRCTGNMVMELTGASVFGLDLKKKQWLYGIFRYMGLDAEKFPPLVRSIDKVGELRKEAAGDFGLLAGTPVIAGAGDAPCAAVGSGAVGEGEGHVYLGTSGWVGVVTSRTLQGKRGVATIHSADPDKVFLFAESEAAGACIQWVADQFYKAEENDPGIPNVYALMDERVAAVPPGANYLVFTPWIYGERAPVDDTCVRASFLNLSAEHTREDLLRAVYEGVAYNIRWIVEIVEKEFKFPLPRLRVVGGGARGRPWMQVLADVTCRKIETVYDPQEAGAVGAALVAAVGLGVHPDFESLRKVVRVQDIFEPQVGNTGLYDSLYQSYKEVYRSLRGFYRRLNKDRFRKERKEVC